MTRGRHANIAYLRRDASELDTPSAATVGNHLAACGTDGESADIIRGILSRSETPPSPPTARYQYANRVAFRTRRPTRGSASHRRRTPTCGIQDLAGDRDP